MATLRFLGAIEGVTGSCYLLTARDVNILLDCGLFQGQRHEEDANLQPFPFDIESIDAVVLSHAHLDHSGRLPVLVTNGLACPIYMTHPTADLIDILLKDAASLQQRDAEWENKRRQRADKDPITPLYTLEDVALTLQKCKGIHYRQRICIAEGIELMFLDAGHILGSSIVNLFIDEAGSHKKLVFSGDLGNSDAALLEDPEIVENADVLLLESTYGDRNHRSMQSTLEEFENILHDASENGGNILIPSFAVGRTQEILFRLGELYQQGKIKQQAIYLDSPMAIAVTEIYHRYQNVFNQEDNQAMSKNGHPQSLHKFLPVLRYSTSTDESMALNRIDSGAIFIAGSGMCNGGRIRHHLKHNIWRNRSHVIFVGYQALGTPGRAIIDGATYYKIAGEDIKIKAHIHTIGGFSAHASQSQLIEWVSHFKAPRPRLYLVHGEEKAKIALQKALKESDWDAKIPELDSFIEF